MKNDTVEKIAFAVLGVTVGLLFSEAFIAYKDVPQDPPTCVEAQQEYDAYQMCLQTADDTGCTMQVEDFSRFAKLEERLKDCE